MKFIATPGAPLTDRGARVYGRHLYSLMQAKEGIQTEDVVEDARNPLSPIHPWFTWDDTEAATKQRLLEARQLMCSIMTVVKLKDGTSRVRAFYSVVA